jgi:hypothetical protein
MPQFRFPAATVTPWEIVKLSKFLTIIPVSSVSASQVVLLVNRPTPSEPFPKSFGADAPANVIGCP